MPLLKSPRRHSFFYALLVFYFLSNQPCLFCLASPQETKALETFFSHKSLQEEAYKAQELMAHMRALLMHRAYQFTLELKHKDATGHKTTHKGLLKGSHVDGHHKQSVCLHLSTDNSSRPIQLEALDGQLVASSQAPLPHKTLPSLGATSFDLLTPYLYWKDAHYAGSSKRSGRHKHHLEVYAPQEDMGIVRRVDIEVQEPHRYLLKAECFDADNRLVSVLKTLGIQRKKPYHPTKIEWAFPLRGERLQIIFHDPLFGLDEEAKIVDGFGASEQIEASRNGPLKADKTS